MGNYAYFGTTPIALGKGIDWLAVPLCGIIGGAAGGLFSRILIAVARGLPGAVFDIRQIDHAKLRDVGGG